MERGEWKAGDLVLCKLRNGYRRLVLVLEAHPYQLWSGNTTNHRWRYTILQRNGDISKMHLKPEWLLQRTTGGGQDGKR